ncbi:hypothetical protein [Streptomyces sp. NPDC127098]|uniref:hypothetical protein n=1 Tax=Streptomyces sp. NPDC127098 TaxID=3347137 RepID=UPI00365BF5C5
MKETTRAALAAGIASGYLMGRTKKAKVALAIASYVVSRGFGGGRHGSGSGSDEKQPGMPQLGQMGGQLLQAGRNIAGHRIDALADALQARSVLLDGHHEQDGGEEEPEEEKRDTGRAQHSRQGTAGKGGKKKTTQQRAKAGTARSSGGR